MSLMMAMIHLKMLLFLTPQSKEHCFVQNQFVFHYHLQRSTQDIRHCIYILKYTEQCVTEIGIKQSINLLQFS